MQVSAIDVEAVNLGRRLALLSDNSTANIDVFIDIFGEVTDDPSEAVTMVIPLPCGKCWTGPVSDYQNAKVN